MATYLSRTSSYRKNSTSINKSQWTSSGNIHSLPISDIGSNYSPMSQGDDVSKIGGYIRARRTHLGLTQEQLEEITGLKQNYISLVERGKVARPRDDALEAFARGLDVSMDDLKVAMGYVVSTSMTATGKGTATVDGVVVPAVTVPDDPRVRLFLKKTGEKELTDAQWEKLLRILDEDDDSGG